MKIQHLTKFIVVSMIVGSLTSPARSSGQSTQRDDSLKPFTTCQLESGLKIVQVDRLPKDVKSRKVETGKGDQKVSLADGYRVMVAYNEERDWFANIKVEKSVAAEYERDKENVFENLKWAVSKDTEGKIEGPVKVSFGGREGYGTSKRALGGNLLGIYLLFSDEERTIITIYFINQNDKRKRFQTIEEWQTVRDEFLKTYTTCIDNNRKLLER